MDWSAHLDTVAVAALFGSLTGWFIPVLVARLPEPAEPDEGKVAYATLGTQAGMPWRTALWSAVVAGLIAASLGWAWSLIVLLPLVPIGVTLGWIDYRTKLLPKLIIGPSYLLVIALILVCTALTRDLDDVWRAGLGWLIAGAVYWFLWRFTPGMGYGDVRLSGVLGLALGYLGWGEFAVGMYAAFLVGVLGWVPLRLLGITGDRSFPFGPFMLIGAVIGVLWGADLGGHLAGGRG